MVIKLTATKAVIEREAPGIVAALLTESLKITPFAMASRLAAGTREDTLIINFPGSTKAVNECFSIVSPVLKHCVQQIRGEKEPVQSLHARMSSSSNGGSSDAPVTSANASAIVISMSKVEAPPPALRDRTSPYAMIEVDEAMKIILKETTSSPVTELIFIKDLKQLVGKCLAVDMKSNVNLPAFPTSVKDGYAVQTVDGAGRRRVLATATAGSLPNKLTVQSGSCIRISTGAPVPMGADAVVPVENTELISSSPSGEEIEILITQKPTFGQDIRTVGCDIKKGQVILKAGAILGPASLGLLASVGYRDVPVLRKPIVGILSTGDELIEAGESYREGKIWDSNKTSLAALLCQRNVDFVDLGIARDEASQIYNKLVEAFDKDIDVLITTGGVSMGEKDVLKRVLEVGFEGKVHFGRVNIKPGKPMAFITCDWKGSKKFIFALPGNPVSAFVTCFLFALPAIRVFSGYKVKLHTIAMLDLHKHLNAILKISKSLPLDTRPEYARGILTFESGSPQVELIAGSQASSRLASVRDANALVLLPPKTPQRQIIQPNEVVTVILID